MSVKYLILLFVINSVRCDNCNLNVAFISNIKSPWSIQKDNELGIKVVKEDNVLTPFEKIYSDTNKLRFEKLLNEEKNLNKTTDEIFIDNVKKIVNKLNDLNVSLTFLTGLTTYGDQHDRHWYIKKYFDGDKKLFGITNVAKRDVVIPNNNCDNNYCTIGAIYKSFPDRDKLYKNNAKKFCYEYSGMDYKYGEKSKFLYTEYIHEGTFIYYIIHNNIGYINVFFNPLYENTFSNDKYTYLPKHFIKIKKSINKISEYLNLFRQKNISAIINMPEILDIDNYNTFSKEINNLYREYNDVIIYIVNSQYHEYISVGKQIRYKDLNISFIDSGSLHYGMFVLLNFNNFRSKIELYFGNELYQSHNLFQDKEKEFVYTKTPNELIITSKYTNKSICSLLNEKSKCKNINFIKDELEILNYFKKKIINQLRNEDESIIISNIVYNINNRINYDNSDLIDDDE